MHRPGEVVAADVLGLGGVAHLAEVGVYQRRVAAPVLGGRVREHYLGNAAPLALHPRQQRIARARNGVGNLDVREGVQLRDDVADVLGRLPESQVELAAHPARDVGDDAVQRHSAALVRVQPVVDIRPQESPALRRAEGVGALDISGGGVAVRLRFVLEERYDVADGRHAQADDVGADGRIDELIDAPRLEAAAQIDVVDVRLNPLVLDADELESVARNVGRRSVGMVADGERGGGVVRVGGRMRVVGSVRQQEDVGRLIALELMQYAPGDGLAVRAERGRGAQPDEVGVVGDVALPAAPDDGVAFAHQKAVARFERRGGGEGAGGAVEAENRLASAVDDVEDDAAAPALRIRRLEHLEIGGEADAPVGIAGRRLDVGYRLVGGMRRIHREPRPPFEMPVRADVPKRLAARERGVACYIELGHWHFGLPPECGLVGWNCTIGGEKALVAAGRGGLTPGASAFYTAIRRVGQ